MWKICAAAVIGLMICSASIAQDRGAVTNLPLPRYVSLKAGEGNVRRGPSLTHRIDWIFKHRSMPLKVIAEHGHWRRVVDRDGAGGWIHYSLLSGARTVLIEEDLAPLYSKADETSTVAAYAELGSIARFDRCADGWCKVSASGAKGFVRESKLWGLLPDERQGG